MHELPITQSICTMAVNKATELGAKRIIQIQLKQGEYVDYVPEIIQEYFNVVSEGTIAEGAELVIETIPTVIHCLECNTTSTGKDMRLRCPVCNSEKTEIRSGKDIYIENMMIED